MCKMSYLSFEFFPIFLASHSAIHGISAKDEKKIIKRPFHSKNQQLVKKIVISILLRKLKSHYSVSRGDQVYLFRRHYPAPHNCNFKNTDFQICPLVRTGSKDITE